MDLPTTFEKEVEAWLYLESHSTLSPVEQKSFLKVAIKAFLTTEFPKKGMSDFGWQGCKANLRELRQSRTMAQLHAHLSRPDNHLFKNYPGAVHHILVTAYETVAEEGLISHKI